MSADPTGRRIAVVLFNLGGPDDQASVKPFLFNLFSDPAIIGLPNPFRALLARLISSRRETSAQAAATSSTVLTSGRSISGTKMPETPIPALASDSRS